MSKNQLLKFHETKSEDDFRSFIRQISASTLLENMYILSKEVYFGGCTIDNLSKHVSEKDPRTGRVINQDIIIQPWQFPDLAYFVIKYSNDYRGLTGLSRNMVLMILGQTNEYLSEKTKELLTDLNSAFDINLFAYGFGGEQFRYQTPLFFYQRLIRELYIVFSISKQFGSKIIPDNVIKEETGIEWKDLIISLFGIFIGSFFQGSIHPSLDNLTFDEEKDKQFIFERIVDYYSADYEEIRNSLFGRQLFYLKPFIRTQNNGLVTASVYLNQFIVEHAPFWILRNYYQKQPKKHRQDFTDEFGNWFELYFQKLCNTFSIKNERILEEEKRKRADWKLEIGDYTFLVEQKSAIVQLSVKQQLTDFKSYKAAIHKTIFKALDQLQETESDLAINKPVKLILCYDDYIDANILPLIFSESDCPVENDNRYFLVNIMEMEMLFSLASLNKELFDVVIKDMLSRNINKSKDGISLLQIMRDNGFSTNLFWVSPVFDEYKELLKDIKNRHEKFREVGDTD